MIFLLFAYDRYDASGGIEDLITTSGTLDGIEKFINDNPGKILSYIRPFERVYAYEPNAKEKYNYINNKFILDNTYEG